MTALKKPVLRYRKLGTEFSNVTNYPAMDFPNEFSGNEFLKACLRSVTSGL